MAEGTSLPAMSSHQGMPRVIQPACHQPHGPPCAGGLGQVGQTRDTKPSLGSKIRTPPPSRKKLWGPREGAQLKGMPLTSSPSIPADACPGSNSKAWPAARSPAARARPAAMAPAKNSAAQRPPTLASASVVSSNSSSESATSSSSPAAPSTVLTSACSSSPAASSTLSPSASSSLSGWAAAPPRNRRQSGAFGAPSSASPTTSSASSSSGLPLSATEDRAIGEYASFGAWSLDGLTGSGSHSHSVVVGESCRTDGTTAFSTASVPVGKGGVCFKPSTFSSGPGSAPADWLAPSSAASRSSSCWTSAAPSGAKVTFTNMPKLAGACPCPVASYKAASALFMQPSQASLQWQSLLVRTVCTSIVTRPLLDASTGTTTSWKQSK
mmetsp:Transcript_104504/g.300403  ORF Transcript_104504/g.300403 Transcript_104504/m.300403 type:complete len:382 (-) Transcript_104504:967-2112(-)